MKRYHRPFLPELAETAGVLILGLALAIIAAALLA